MDTKLIQPHLVEVKNEHWYKGDFTGKGEEYYASITTKLKIKAKPFLAKWRGDIGNREADVRVFEAQQRGKRIHNAWYNYLEKGIVIYRNAHSEEEIQALKKKFEGRYQILPDQDEMYQMYKLQTIFKELKPEVVSSERTVYSTQYREAGTMDNLWKIKAGTYDLGYASPIKLPGGVYVGDLKTGSTVDDDAWMQLAAYVAMVRELKLAEPVGALIFHTQALTKKKYAVKHCLLKDLGDHYEQYRHLAAVWDLDNKKASPRLFKFPSIITRVESEIMEVL